jgi:DNA-directed RNA polymerase specialized sigma subunit
MRLKEIAQALDFSEAHICQSHAKAILAIRAFIEGSERGRRQTKDRQP